MTNDKSKPEYWADWLVDAVATSTQDRMFLRGEPECDEVACDAIYLNGLKAIQNTIKVRADLSPSPEVVKELVEAAGDFLDAVFAEYENGDRKLRITGPTANLKWLIEAEEELRAVLAKLEGGE